ncbi:MAG TPA: DNA polymerase III subunit gamma/tau [Patescibacteria group bacterium]|nr:DNA polymerase III subunit gamma/tau [Patescibacteria group bacterium]
MSQALYRKYRPKKLGQVAGQEHITRSLSNAIKTNKINHAYLFSGPKGVGKTSIARILAHDVNDLKYIDEASHIDIIEIDAASNRRIDEIRELREMVYMAPVSAKYKVYIIDEVHMLTKEAFNALLKTLEEPPAHVIFILATTDIHKLPDTIISRTQSYTFKPISDSQVKDRLKFVTNEEKMAIEDSAIDHIAKYSQGSLRDSLNILDQARNHAKGKINTDQIIELLGLPPRNSISEILNLIQNSGENTKLMSVLNELNESGHDPSQIAKEISLLLRQKIISNEVDDKVKYLDLLEKLLYIPQSIDPLSQLEITLLKSMPEKSTKDKDEVIVKEPVEVVAEPISKTLKINEENWPKILNALKDKHNTLYGIVRMAEPKFNDDQITLNFEFEFHIKRLNEANNKRILNEVIKSLTGHEFQIILNHKPEKSNKTKKNENIKNVSAIFNGAKLIES